MTRDALGAHARDELGISETLPARPLQAAVASAATFATGAALPLLTAVVTPTGSMIAVVSGSSLLFLALLGAMAARAGGGPVMRSILRVTFWGAVAMGLTSAVGALFGTVA